MNPLLIAPQVFPQSQVQQPPLNLLINKFNDNFVNETNEILLNEWKLLSERAKEYFLARNISDGDFKDSLIELINAVLEGHLSSLQVNILLSKLEGKTYKVVREKHGIKSDQVLERALLRTACGKYWNENMKGGGEPIFSILDIEKFVSYIEERENEINCVSTCEARRIVSIIQDERVTKARELLNRCGCPILAERVKMREPDDSWLNKKGKAFGLAIVPKCEIETMRRIACDEVTIREFFDKHEGLLNRDPRLIFNMDETMVSSKKRFKVLCKKGHVPLSTSDQIFPHITACITIGASGKVLKPMFILPNKKTLGGLEEFEGLAYFASSRSGWINRDLFTYWGLTFLSEISLYRLTLPSHLRKQRILLLLDGHKSRINYFIAKLFDIYGIDILVFPGHTSHVLQPFDVGVASSLKSEYRRLILLYTMKYGKEMEANQNRLTARDLRIMMIRCMLDAISKSASIQNIQAGYRQSGIFPLDSKLPLSSKFAMDQSLRNKFPDLYKNIKNANMIGNHHLNGSNINLEFTFKANYHRIPNETNMEISQDKINKEIRNFNSFDCKILTEIPDFFVDENNAITRVKFGIIQ